MNRLSLPEIEDSPRLPRWLRDAITGYLQVAISVGKPYAVVTPLLAELLRGSADRSVVDLASGGGGPWPELMASLKATLGAHPSVTLTDIQPNLRAAAAIDARPGLSYRREPVSALNVPPELGRVRTMFTGLHHFDEGEVLRIFRAAQDAKAPFLAAEATHRSVPGLLITLLVPVLVLLFMPRVRPLRVLPLLLTYVPPLLPAMIWWDGVASTLKSYRADELRALVSSIETPGYRWRVEELAARGAPIPVTVVVGQPTDS